MRYYIPPCCFVSLENTLSNIGQLAVVVLILKLMLDDVDTRNLKISVLDLVYHIEN